MGIIRELGQPGARIVTTQGEQFNEKEQQDGEVTTACENVEGRDMWHNWNTFPQAAQKVRPARPQPMKAPEA